MAEVGIVDTTLRDGNQSLWSARGVTTDLVRRAAPLIDRAGFVVSEFITSTIMAMAIKHHREDPWERIRLARRLMPNTRLGFLTSGKRFITWDRTPDSLLQMAYELLVRNGISRFWVCDPMVDSAGAIQVADMAKRAGALDVVAALTFSISPIHTDEFYARAAAELDGCDDIDALYIKDPAGLLTPERLGTLVAAVRSGLSNKPLLEIHSHCNTGLSPRTVLDAVDLGIEVVHCAVGVASNGTSHPSARRFAENLTARGHNTALDLDALGDLESCLAEHAAEHGLPTGHPLEYDETYYHHQLPGGIISTLQRQLAEIGRTDLLPAIKEEVVRVRHDFGYPILVTPFPQFVATQALLNLLGSERYGTLADEVVRYLLGEFGDPPGPVNQELVDRAASTAAGRSLVLERSEPTRTDLRRRFGPSLSEEDLLMSAVLSPEEVAAVGSSRPRTRPGPSWTRPVQVLLEELRDHPRVWTFSLHTPTLHLELRREA